MTNLGTFGSDRLYFFASQTETETDYPIEIFPYISMDCPVHFLRLSEQPGTRKMSFNKDDGNDKKSQLLKKLFMQIGNVLNEAQLKLLLEGP